MFYGGSAEPRSSGGAILNHENYKVIDLHKGRANEKLNKGIFIKKGIDGFLNRDNFSL